MPTTSPAYGRLLTLKFNGTAILNLKSSDLSQSVAMRDVTTKDSSDNKESRPTIHARTFSFSGLMPNAGPNAAAGPALQTALDAGSIGTWNFGSNLTAEPNWSGSGFLTALNFKAPHDGNVEFDGTVEVTGVVTFGVN